MYPTANDAPRVGGCCRGLAGVPGSVDAPAAGGHYRGQRLLPGLTSDPGFSGRSPRPALSPRRRERRLRKAPGDRAGLPEAGRVLQALLEIHRHLHLASAWPRKRRRRSSGSCGSGGAEERWHRGSRRRWRALGRL